MDKEYFDKLIYDIKKPSMHFNYEEVEIDGPTTESHLGGLPFMLKKDVWPECDVCKNKMDFIMQLRELDQFETIILKTIYSCKCELHKYKPNIQILQYVNPIIENAVAFDYRHPNPYVKLKLAPSWSIPKWDMFKSLYPELVEQYKKDFIAAAGVDRDLASAYSTYRYNNNMVGSDPFSGYGGYAEFVSVPKRSKCTCCGKEAEFVFQLDSISEYNVDWEQMTLYCHKCKNTGLHSFFLS